MHHCNLLSFSLCFGYVGRASVISIVSIGVLYLQSRLMLLKKYMSELEYQKYKHIFIELITYVCLHAVTHRRSSERETHPGMEAAVKAPEAQIPLVRKPVEQLFDGKCNTITTCP